MKYGSIGKRIAAFLIDAIVVNVVGAALVASSGEWMFSLSSVLIGAIYYIFTEGGSMHATLGKKLLGLTVVDKDGVGIDYGRAAVRYAGRLLSAALCGIGFVVALFDDKNCTLYDMLAGSFVTDDAYAVAGGHSVIGVCGEMAGRRFPITGRGLMIGRDSMTSQIVLRRSVGISRLHCFVSFNPSSGLFVLTDRNSTCGTFTGAGVRVTPRKSVALRPGERFYLGGKDTVFEVR